MTREDRALLDEQIAYYRARAPEYEDWFFRRGRYDLGEAHRRAWNAELAIVEEALRAAGPSGRVLELACGTGLWTRHLVGLAETVVAVDASRETLALAEERVGSERVRYVQADLFEWAPAEAFDFVFFGFWLSHVPPERLEDFWRRVRAALRPGGRAFFVDSARDSRITSRDQRIPAEGDPVMERTLEDGRRFRVVKIFYEPAALERRLAALGWEAAVRSSGEFFVYGEAATAP